MANYHRKRSRQDVFYNEHDLGNSINLDLRTPNLDGNFPNFRQPSIVGSFSLDDKRQFMPGRDHMKFCPKYPQPKVKVNLDLNEGLKSVIRKNEDQCKEEKLSRMLKWISLNKEKFSNPNSSDSSNLNTDFVCFRGLLTTLLCTPYEYKEGWIIHAMKWRNTIYLCQRETPEQKEQRLSQNDRQKAMCSWGYKFEQFILQDTPNAKPNTAEPVNENEEFCCMFRTRLANNSIVYGAEMDGVECNDDIMGVSKDNINLNKVKFVELKTSRQMTDDRQYYNFGKFKLRKWWCQSFLVGIDKILCGFRDDDGIVLSLEMFKVSEIPKQVQETWKPNVCMNFLNQFLEKVKHSIKENSLNQMYILTWNPKLDKSKVWIKEKGFISKEESILPDWFVNNST